MHFVFRTDASNEIGTGHVIRCLSLAGVLAEKGMDILFICREHEGNLCNFIEEKGFTVIRLPLLRDSFIAEDDSAHACWLGAGWNEDAEQTCAIIHNLDIKPDWLVVDNYGIDYRWEKILRPLADRIFVIDDLANRNHDCDILLDQNLVAEMHNRYLGKVPENCRLLLGPDYALLHPIYAELHDRIPPRDGQIRRILISFGGADSDDLTGRALSAFINLNRPDIEVDVVISENWSHKYTIEKLASGHGNIHLHRTLPTLAPLMAKADLAIGASGTTSWERLCLGLPAIVITLADNQKCVAEELHEVGAIYLLGDKDEVSVEDIIQYLSKLINRGIRYGMSEYCSKIVDGKGLNRVYASLLFTKILKINQHYNNGNS